MWRVADVEHVCATWLLGRGDGAGPGLSGLFFEEGVLVDQGPCGAEIVAAGAMSCLAEEHLVSGGGVVPQEVGVRAAGAATDPEGDAGDGVAACFGRQRSGVPRSGGLVLFILAGSPGLALEGFPCVLRDG